MSYDDRRRSVLINHLGIKVQDHELLALLGEEEFRAEYAALVTAALELAARRWYPDGAAPDDIVGIVAGFRARAGSLMAISPVTAERVLDAAVNGRPQPPLDWLTATQAGEFLLAQVITDIGITDAEVRELLTTAAEQAREHPAGRAAPVASTASRVSDQDVVALRAACTTSGSDILMNALRPGGAGQETATFISAAFTVAARRWVISDNGGTWDARDLIRWVADIRAALAKDTPAVQYALDPVIAESVLEDAFAGNLRSRHDQIVALPAQLLLLGTFVADLEQDELDSMLAEARSFADQWLSTTTLSQAPSPGVSEDARASA